MGASATFISQAANAGDGSVASPTNLMAKVDLNSSSPGTTGTPGALGSKQSAGTGTGWTSSSAGSAKTNTGAISWTTGGTTAYGFFSTWDSAGTAFGVGGSLGASVTAVTITAAIGALSYLPA